MERGVLESGREASSQWLLEVGSDIYVDRNIGFPDFDIEGPGTTVDIPLNIEAKNRFLGVLADVADMRSNVRDVLQHLELHALSTNAPSDWRYHQLTGLLQIVAAVAKDSEMSELLAKSTLDR